MKKKEELEKLLIVVDMVNGFIKEGNMADPFINHITPGIVKLIEERTDDTQVVFIKDTHSEDSTEFKKFPVHCLKGTSESELISELKPYENDALVYEKNSTCALYAKNFLNDLDSMKKLREIILTGCCSDICVLNLAIALVNYLDEQNRNIKVSVYKELIETYNSREHNREEYNQMSLKLMKQAGIEVR